MFQFIDVLAAFNRVFLQGPEVVGNCIPYLVACWEREVIHPSYLRKLALFFDFLL